MSRWLEALHALKISYITASNKVIVPEVFLQSPLFHVGYPNSVNMGGLGVRVAEAILEGVLGRGLLFDSTGRLVSHPKS
jgi:predicted metalloendopeptidase